MLVSRVLARAQRRRVCVCGPAARARTSESARANTQILGAIWGCLVLLTKKSASIDL